MGSGLILLAIVGAWLAVLVPMALRKHDAGNLGTVEKFHDAMRVLSRREGARGRVAVPDELAYDDVPAGRARAAAGVVRDRLAARQDRPRATPAARRRRVLLGLLSTSVATLAGALLGPLWLLAPHAVVDLLLVAFVVHLRRTAVARAEREWRAAMRPVRESVRESAVGPLERGEPVVGTVGREEPVVARRVAPAARRVLRVPAHVAGIPDRMPPRPQPLEAPAAELAPARGAQGEAWSPVPVPTPTYLTAPAAPRRVVDVTRPGSYAEGQDAGLAEAEKELGIVDSGPELDEILERRRAVNDW